MMPEMSDIQVVVMMGGLATRLKGLAANCPKPLLPVNDRPFFDYELSLLKLAGFKKFLFCTGHMSEEIEAYYKDGTSRDITIAYSKEPEDEEGNTRLLGTGGAIRHAYGLLEEDFLLVYADSFMDINYKEVVYRYFEAKAFGALSLMTLLKNNGNYDTSNVVYKDGRIELYDKKHCVEEMEHIDYGVNMFSKEIFASREDGEVFDLGDLQHELSKEGKLAGLVVDRRFYEIGRPEPYREFTDYARARFDTKRKAAFLDRDGVLNEIVFNEDTEQLDSPMKTDELVLTKGAKDAVKSLKDAGFYVFVVTNQPAAAKGKTSLGNLWDINKHLMELIPEIDEVFVCLHHPKGAAMCREKTLIRECNCRKPKDGLIREAMAKYAVDIEGSYMVGDSFTDIKCGISAGVKTVFIGNFKCDTCKKLENTPPDFVAEDILEAAAYMTGQGIDGAHTGSNGRGCIR